MFRFARLMAVVGAIIFVCGVIFGGAGHAWGAYLFDWAFWPASLIADEIDQVAAVAGYIGFAAIWYWLISFPLYGIFRLLRR